MSYKLLKDGPAVFKLLRGVVCVYKPQGISEGAVKYALLTKLCKELNEMECRPPVDYIKIEGNTTKEMKVTVSPSYADHPLVVGPRYQEKEIRCQWPLDLGVKTSGVFLLGMNEGVRTVHSLDKACHVRTFHVQGQFGRATDTFFTDGLVVERSKFKHVHRPKLDKILASIQAAHQRSMFELSGVDIQSQDAYELAVQGMIRPADPNVPMIYGIKCIEFNPPDFIIEVHSINEYEFYLMSLINEIGVKMHTSAVCTSIRCVRHAYFTVHNALLRKHWTLQNVINNIKDNQKILNDNPQLFSPLLKNAQFHNPRSKDSVAA